MEGCDHILNWRLKVGSHRFPGPDGGTCINEAALIAAGFEYRRIASVHEMPSCFSRPICRFAMLLNDTVTHRERQLLLPFVTRLACADSWAIERKRQAYTRSRMPLWRLSGTRGAEILEGALAIGRQAEPIAPTVVRTRMEAEKDRAAAAASVPGSALVGRIRAWFTAGKVPEPTG